MTATAMVHLGRNEDVRADILEMIPENDLQKRRSQGWSLFCCRAISTGVEVTALRLMRNEKPARRALA